MAFLMLSMVTGSILLLCAVAMTEAGEYLKALVVKSGPGVLLIFPWSKLYMAIPVRV